MKKEVFKQQIQEHEKILVEKNRIFKKIGYIKLLHVVFIGYFIFQIFNNNTDVIVFVINVAIILALGGFWIYHEKLKQEINYAKGIININKHHLDRISGSWVNFADIGSEFVNYNHPYASDLDIVGNKSIFQFLNTTHTWHGRQKFSQDLLEANYTNKQIIIRQEAILELSEDIPFSNHLEYKFSQIGVHAGAKFIVGRLENETPFLKSNLLKRLVLYAPLITVLFGAFTFLTNTFSQLYLIVISLVIIQLFAWLALFLKTAKYLKNVSHLSYNLDAYSDAIDALEKRQFKTDKLKELQKSLTDSKMSAKIAIKELAGISSRANLRRNGIAFVVLNLALLFDLNTAIRFEAWKKKYAKYAKSWFVNLGEFESLLSFSKLPNVTSITCLPVVASGSRVEAKALGHPLINNEKRVSNDVLCENNIFIISGSNMSGKTTFMRTVGVNLILAQAGSFVCAEMMRFSQVKVMTSMRIADDLGEGISTFYAELKRIKTILEMAQKEPNLLFLIDEIFRGTNSIDRLIGAQTILRKLNELNVMGIITTHDLELCEIANLSPRIKNYSFSETYCDQEILFDYKLKKGISKTTNAKYLMEMMDII